MIEVTNDNRLHMVCELIKKKRSHWKKIDEIQLKLSQELATGALRITLKDDIFYHKQQIEIIDTELNEYRRNES
jgi:hypothetical protein